MIGNLGTFSTAGMHNASSATSSTFQTHEITYRIDPTANSPHKDLTPEVPNEGSSASLAPDRWENHGTEQRTRRPDTIFAF